jgi:hypothetical protein
MKLKVEVETQPSSQPAAKKSIGLWLLLIVCVLGWFGFLLVRSTLIPSGGNSPPPAAPEVVPVSHPEDGCPRGCSYRKPGCDIKGNVAFETAERIYHVPGQTYYEETEIRPEAGERWFCSEAEAVENGWRKSRL